MLKEMGNSIVLLSFIPGSSINPDPNSGCGSSTVLWSYTKAIVQNSQSCWGNIDQGLFVTESRRCWSQFRRSLLKNEKEKILLLN